MIKGSRRRCCSWRRARCRDRLCVVGRGLFNAHVSGVAFAYEPTISGTVLNGVVVDLVDASLREKKRCQGRHRAIRRAGQDAGASIESRVIDVNLVAAGDRNRKPPTQARWHGRGSSPSDNFDVPRDADGKLKRFASPGDACVATVEVMRKLTRHMWC